MLVWKSSAGKQWILRSEDSGGSGQLYSSADSVAEYSSAGQFSSRVFHTAMAFQTGKDLQRAQLMLIFPSGSYLKENEIVHCNITVRTAYSKHSTMLSTLHPPLYLNISTRGRSLRAARVTMLFKFSIYKIAALGSQLKKKKDLDTQGTGMWQHPF